MIRELAFVVVMSSVGVGCGKAAGPPTIPETLQHTDIPAILVSCGNHKLDPHEECDSEDTVELFGVTTGCVRCQWDIASPHLAKEVVSDLYKQEITLTARSRVMRARFDDGQVHQVHQFSYDQQGNCTREIQDNDNDGQLEVEIDRRFDENGNATDERRRSVMGDTEVTTRTYDAAARLIKERHQEGTKRTEIHWEYDKSGALDTRWFDDTGDGTAAVTIKFTYDANGRKRLEVLARHDQPTTSRTEYEYDSNGLMINERSDRDGDGTWESTKAYEYSPAGQVRAVVLDGTAKARITYDYDPSGHMVRRVIGSAQGEEVTTAQYDDRGNLIRSTTTEGDIVRRDEQFRYDQTAADEWRRRIKALLVARQARRRALDR